MGSPDLCSRAWIWQQYDHMVGADTVQRPGGDAAVVRVHGARKALAMTTDCTPRYCFADPHEGGKQAVAESWRNLICVGAKPLAITNCLNFASPQNPVVMGQLVGCIEGMAEACRALDYPVVSGNVSLYNESRATGGGRAILPTPAIGGVGLVADWEKTMTLGFKAEGEDIWLVGGDGVDHLGQSIWLREIHGREDGPPPRVDLALERAAGDFVAELIASGKASAVHDVSDGGVLVALAEMALAGGIGAEVEPMTAAEAFGEGQARYLVTMPEDWTFFEAPVRLRKIGRTEGETLMGVALADLRAAHTQALPAMLAG
jgi:phosphoribosylformylglycinamidine synthase